MLKLNEEINLTGLPKNSAVGIIEFIIKDRNGNIVDRIIERNIIKIFAKEMLSHRLPSSEIWDQEAGSGGAWVASGIDPDEEFSARYILFGASYDSHGTPLGTDDTRFYQVDLVTGQYIPIRLDPSAAYDGGLINAIPIEEPIRPVKRIESITFNNTYQPSGSPLIDADVRGMNNIVVLETVLRSDEYNGFSNSDTDFFTITEVALVGGRKFNTVAQCGLDPKDLFLQGDPIPSVGVNEVAIPFTANGTNVISLDGTVSSFTFKIGDQVKIVNRGGNQGSYTILDQVNPYYLIIDTLGGDIQLDRVPVDNSGNSLSGDIGLFRSTLRIFSHRVVTTPVTKSASFEITCRWSIIFN
jgi:hypothetical protein